MPQLTASQIADKLTATQSKIVKNPLHGGFVHGGRTTMRALRNLGVVGAGDKEGHLTPLGVQVSALLNTNGATR